MVRSGQVSSCCCFKRTWEAIAHDRQARRMRDRLTDREGRRGKQQEEEEEEG